MHFKQIQWNSSPFLCNSQNHINVNFTYWVEMKAGRKCLWKFTCGTSCSLIHLHYLSILSVSFHILFICDPSANLFSFCFLLSIPVSAHLVWIYHQGLPFGSSSSILQFSPLSCCGFFLFVLFLSSRALFFHIISCSVPIPNHIHLLLLQIRSFSLDLAQPF